MSGPGDQLITMNGQFKKVKGFQHKHIEVFRKLQNMFYLKLTYQPVFHLVEKGVTALYTQWFLMKSRVNLQIANHKQCQPSKEKYSKFTVANLRICTEIVNCIARDKKE